MGKPPESVIEIRRRITQVVSDRGPHLVAAYYAQENGFAGDMFDNFGNNPADRFTADDFVAASCSTSGSGRRASEGY